MVSLHTALREISDEEQNPESLLNRSGNEKGLELQDILANCRSVLSELEQLLSKYGSLSTANLKGKTLDRLRFGSKNLSSIREKLVFHTSAISLFLHTLGTGRLGRIEKRLDELIQEVKNGQRETTTIMIFGDQNEPQDVYWNRLETALQSEGISKDEVDAHKHGIRAYLQEQAEKLQLPIRSIPREISGEEDTIRPRLTPEIADDSRRGHLHPAQGNVDLEEMSDVRMSGLDTNKYSLPPEQTYSARPPPQLPSPSTSSPEDLFFERRNSGSFQETCTDVQEFDDFGRLKRRVITRQSSNSSINTNRSADSPFSAARPHSSRESSHVSAEYHNNSHAPKIQSRSKPQNLVTHLTCEPCRRRKLRCYGSNLCDNCIRTCL